MCSIFGSYDKGKIVELAMLNAYRGGHSYSFSYYDPKIKRITYMQKALGLFPIYDVDIPEGQYCIAHMQAPTTDNKTETSIHPANIGRHYLWHNGIIKDNWIKKFIASSGAALGYITWDTYLILHKYKYTKNLNGIDGTFSCLYYEDGEGLQLFRNEISPMFIDDKGNISSTKFTDSRPLEPNYIWQFIPGQPMMEIVGSFDTVENPYFFMDEAI